MAPVTKGAASFWIFSGFYPILGKLFRRNRNRSIVKMSEACSQFEL